MSPPVADAHRDEQRRDCRKVSDNPQRGRQGISQTQAGNGALRGTALARECVRGRYVKCQGLTPNFPPSSNTHLCKVKLYSLGMGILD